MNVHVRNLEPEAYPPTTQAAEGLPRRRWTVDEIDRLAELGFFGGADRERERFELIGGEVVPMSAKGAWHEDVKRLLNIFWARALPTRTTMLQETTLRDHPYDFREPDFIFWPSSVKVADLAPAHVEFIVEVSDSSLGYDLSTKAAYYAKLGLPDYWVIDARRLVTHVHRDPAGEAWGSVTQHPHSELITPLRISALAVRLADLGLEPVQPAG